MKGNHKMNEIRKQGKSNSFCLNLYLYCCQSCIIMVKGIFQMFDLYKTLTCRLTEIC